jgi:hypothetical protein
MLPRFAIALSVLGDPTTGLAEKATALNWGCCAAAKHLSRREPIAAFKNIGRARFTVS